MMREFLNCKVVAPPKQRRKRSCQNRPSRRLLRSGISYDEMAHLVTSTAASLALKLGNGAEFTACEYRVLRAILQR